MDEDDVILRSLIQLTPNVDLQLKNLKLAGRRLRNVLILHETELQILHRLHYKNKNQHRGAVFWRRVVEMRRYSEQLANMKLQSLFDNFRAQFYGLQSSSVATRNGPWTHVPSVKATLAARRRLIVAGRLADVMAFRCTGAYRLFNETARSASFLQLMLLFSAISARLHVICTELKDILTLVTKCFDEIMVVAQTATDQKVPRTLIADYSASLDIVENEARVKPDFGLTLDYNITASIEASSGKEACGNVQRDSLGDKVVNPKTRPSKRNARNDKIVPNKPSSKKARRNEIDDIFGF